METKAEVVDNIVVNYFMELFMATQPKHEYAVILQGDDLKVLLVKQQDSLALPFVERTLYGAPLKGPRIGRISYGVLLEILERMVGKNVMKLALTFSNGEGIVEEINQTFTVLIPKINNATKISNFRLISLCNVLYKLIAKNHC